jgi:hypothetical protein
MLYRVKQFIWAATARLSINDITFINSYLNDYEKKIFSSLPTSIQNHSIKVSREVLEECLKWDLYDILLIKAALLHDIGQANRGLNCVTKSIIVIADKLFPSISRKCNKIGFVKAYYEHAEMALDVLYMEPEYIKFLIKNHHNYNIENDEKLKILQKADSRN